MVQFLLINFFSWISSIFVGFFKSSRFFCVALYITDTFMRTSQFLVLTDLVSSLAVLKNLISDA